MNIDKTYPIFKRFFKNRENEHIILMGINEDEIILVADITEESSDEMSTFKFSKALNLLCEMNCDSCILAHNHPNGIALPSDSDLEITRSFQEFLLKNNIKLLEHLVYADIFWRVFRDSFHIKEKRG